MGALHTCTLFFFSNAMFSVLPHLFGNVFCLFFFEKRLIITLFACSYCCWFISLRYCVFSYRFKVSVNFVVFETHVFSLVKSSILRLLFRFCYRLLLQPGGSSLSISFQFFVTHKNNTHAHLSMIPRTWALCFFFLIGGLCVCVIMCIDFRSLLITNMTFLFVLLVLLKILLHF